MISNLTSGCISKGNENRTWTEMCTSMFIAALFKIAKMCPWLVGSVGWSIVICTEKCQVLFLVRAHTKVLELDPWSGCE